MASKNGKPCTVYALTDRSGTVHYVGQTRYSLENRLSRHFSEVRQGLENDRTAWIRKEISSGGIVLIKSLEANAVWDDAEERWIAHFRQKNPQLLNLFDRAKGPQERLVRSAETRDKMSEAQKVSWDNPEYREKVVAAIKAERNTPEAKKRLSEMQKAAWQKDEIREARIATRNKTVQGEEFREKMRASATQQMSDPAVREHLRQKNKQRYINDPSARERSAEGARKGWADPVKRAARIEAIRRARQPKVEKNTEG